MLKLFKKDECLESDINEHIRVLDTKIAQKEAIIQAPNSNNASHSNSAHSGMGWDLERGLVNASIDSDPDIQMWRAKKAALNAALETRNSVGDEMNHKAVFTFFATKYSQTLYSKGLFSKTPQLVARTEKSLKDKVTPTELKKIKLKAKIKTHISIIQGKLDRLNSGMSGPQPLSFERIDGKLWEYKLGVLRLALAALDAEPSTCHENLEKLIQIDKQKIYSQGMFSKTKKYIGEALNLSQRSIAGEKSGSFFGKFKR